MTATRYHAARLVIGKGSIELFARDCTTIDNAKVWAKKWRDNEGLERYYGRPVVATIYDERGHARRRAKFIVGGLDLLRWEWL